VEYSRVDDAFIVKCLSALKENACVEASVRDKYFVELPNITYEASSYLFGDDGRLSPAKLALQAFIRLGRMVTFHPLLRNEIQ
jgi:hypothetical protein